MFKGKTVIVVGAGASTEFGLPDGEGLKKGIHSLLDMEYDHFEGLKKGDREIWAAIKKYLNDNNLSTQPEDDHYFQACGQICNTLPQSESVDNYIHSHRGHKGIELCAKLAIVRSILDAEKNSNLYIDTSNIYNKIDFKKNESTWLNKFFILLTSGYLVEEIAERLTNITFIIFNYDRCIEHFLYHSLQNYCLITGNEAAKLLEDLNIYHPYGTVGNLHWRDSENIADFGTEPNVGLLLELVSQIKTFTEGTDPESSEIKAIRKSIRDANMVLFLGLAFRNLTLDLIRPEIKTKEPIRRTLVFATAKNYSIHNRDISRNKLQSLCYCNLNNVVIRNELGCKELFTDYSESFSS